MPRKKTRIPLQQATEFSLRGLFLFLYQMLVSFYLARIDAVVKNRMSKNHSVAINNSDTVIVSPESLLENPVAQKPLVEASQDFLSETGLLNIAAVSIFQEDRTDGKTVSIEKQEGSKKRRGKKKRAERAMNQCASTSLTSTETSEPMADSKQRLFQPIKAMDLQAASPGTTREPSPLSICIIDDIQQYSGSALKKEFIIDDSSISVISDLTMSPFKEEESSTQSLFTVDSTASRISSLNPDAAEFCPLSLSPGGPVRRLVRKETYRKPPCYINHFPSINLINQLSTHFINSGCEGYIFGSTNYKQNELPHDVDIVIENINKDEARMKFDALLVSFQHRGAIVTENKDGSFGYKKPNRFVVPMEWGRFKIDFIVSEHDILEHSKKMDFTVGAMYFNLRQKKMYYISPLTTLVDLDAKRLQTIGDPLESFTADLSRMFRGVRLVAGEGFHFSKKSQRAINRLFAGSSNPFNQMSTGKLFQQLDLLFSSRYPAYNIQILCDMGVFFKLHSRLMDLAYCGGGKYLQQMNYIQTLHSPHAGRGSYHETVCFFQPHFGAETKEHLVLSQKSWP